MIRHSVLWRGALVLLVLLAASIPRIARADYSEEFELALARGEHLFQAGNVQEAAKYFDLCLQIEPASGRANGDPVRPGPGADRGRELRGGLGARRRARARGAA